jgi:hypothetical protein
MKIDYAIVSCDDNKTYSDFWPIVKKLWFKLIGIKPILVKITDHNSTEIFDDCVIHNIKKIDGVNTGFQSQIARMYITKFYKDSVCITSDIDMLPLSKKYFVDNLEKYDQENFLILSSDAYQNTKRFPICYNVAKGYLFDDILNIENNFEDYCKKLYNFNNGWDCDELYFGKKIYEYNNQNNIIKLNRGWEFGRAIDRIDRVFWKYDDKKLSSGEYIDCHSLRPYSNYFNEVDKILNIVL